MKFNSILFFFIVFFLLFKKLENFENFENFENLESVHKKLKILNGNFKDELPEQKMIFKHIKHDCKILELGPNIGRSSLIANYKLKNKKNHVCIETIKKYCEELKENRDLNNMEFKIFEGAISDEPLYQKEWRTINKKKMGYSEVNTKSLKYIIDKYKIDFDTIIADCEGCLVPILKKNEWFLKQIKLIILEHDFYSEVDYNLFFELMKKHNFKLKDKIMKGQNGAPDINWKEGIKQDKIFVSVWEKYV